MAAYTCSVTPERWIPEGHHHKGLGRRCNWTCIGLALQTMQMAGAES